MPNNRSRLSDTFSKLQQSLNRHDLTLNQLLNELGDRSHAIIILVFSLPFLTPIPVPGLSVIFGIIVMISSVAMVFDWPIKIPRKLGERNISSPKIASAIEHISKYSQKIEKLIHPRGEFLIENIFSKVFFCLLIFISAFILALPLPPGTNFPPALVCLLIAIGMLERDLVFIILGMISFIMMIVVFSSMSALIYKSIESFLNYFKF